MKQLGACVNAVHVRQREQRLRRGLLYIRLLELLLAYEILIQIKVERRASNDPLAIAVSPGKRFVRRFQAETSPQALYKTVKILVVSAEQTD